MVERLCQCGCGTVVPAGSYFVRGHNLRLEKYKEIVRNSCRKERPKCPACGKAVPNLGNKYCSSTHYWASMRGRTLSEEHKRKLREVHLGEENHFYGKRHTFETKVLLSQKQKRRIAERAALGEKHQPMLKHKHSVETRQRISESLRSSPNVLRGPVHPGWKGGVANFPYGPEMKESLKAAIRFRDGNLCRLCGGLEPILGRRLSVHHIDYDKRNYDPQNLLSLCSKCHGKVSGDVRNRNLWRELLAERMEDSGAKVERKIFSSPEWSQRMRETANRVWPDPIQREQRLKKLEEVVQTEEYKALLTAYMKDTFTSVDVTALAGAEMAE